MFSIITKAGRPFKSLQKTKVFHLAFLALLLFSFLQIFVPQTVLAKGEQYSWIDKKTIQGSGGAYNGNVTFVQSGTEPQGYVRFSTEYIKITGSDCPRYIITLTTQPDSNPDRAGLTWASPSEDVCRKPANEILDKSVNIGNVANATKEPGSDSASNTQTGDVNRDGKIDEADKVAAASGTSASGQVEKSCESEGGEMSWILCPLLRQADNIVEKLDRTINSFLQVPNRYFEGKAGDNLRDTWARLRNIAFIILIPIMLIMVISTAAGSNMFDAYTVKKALPRLFAAVLFMALSFDLCIFMVTFINEVGSGVAGLITSSFGGVESITLASLFDPHLASGVVATGAGVFAGGLLLTAGPGVIGSFALVTVVALIAGFVVLSIRQVLIIFLILFSPLAILAWIFPGNDKLWKLWWGSFSKLLLLYPLVVGLIAFGKVFAKLVDQSLDVTTQDAQSGLPDALLKLVAYIGPYFFIPATFKLAGGLFATITGAVNDKSRGFFDKQRKKRAEIFKERKARAGSNKLFNPHSKFSKPFNTLTSWTASPIGNAKYSTGQFGQKHGIRALSGVGAGIGSHIFEQSLEHTGKLHQRIQQAMLNDKGLSAIAGAHDVKDANGNVHRNSVITRDGRVMSLGSGPLQTVADIDKAASILEQSENLNDQKSAAQLRGLRGTIGGLYRDPEMMKANVAGAALMEWSRQGFAGGESIARVANEVKNDHHGGAELAEAIANRATVLGQQSRPDIKTGYTVMYDDVSGQYFTTQHDDAELESQGISAGARAQAVQKRKDLVTGVKQHEWVSAKSMAVRDSAKGIIEAARSADGQEMRETILMSASSLSSSDPVSKAEWRAIRKEVYGSDEAAEAEQARYDELYSKERAASSRSGAPSGISGGEGGSGTSGGSGASGSGGGAAT